MKYLSGLKPCWHYTYWRVYAGEVFLPVLSGTVTTLAPFIPLAFWGGTIGKFMHFMPITFIITLTASLLVAYIMNPVFAVDFMKRDEITSTQVNWRRILLRSIPFVAVATLFYLSGSFGMGNFVSGKKFNLADALWKAHRR